MSDKPDWFGMIAKERGLPDAWRWFHAEWRGSGEHAVMLVKGGVDGAVFTRGKNKGKPNPAKRTDERELVITRADMAAVKAKWSAETGNCAECYGSGQVFKRWSKDAGTEMRDCRTCSATGKVAA